MTDTGSLGFGLAFVAGLVSFLSPCVLPLVPSYVTFVTGMTLGELTEGSRPAARARSAAHAAAFVLGFLLVFVALGATATVIGSTLRDWLPALQRVGGVVILLFGLVLLGVLRPGLLQRERRVHLTSRRAGAVGSMVAGVAFGAGWTPCIGPVLASILLYAGIDATMGRGIALLVAYGLGLGIPFFVAAVGLNWWLLGAQRLRRWSRPLERAAGALLVVLGVALATGWFTRLSASLAALGQLLPLGA